jgi:hypothetical protein
MRHGKDTSEYVFSLNGGKVSEGWLTHAFKKAVYDVRLKDDRLHFHIHSGIPLQVGLCRTVFPFTQ